MVRDALVLWNVFRRRYPSGLSASNVVLDIGSGHRPHPSANILLERFIEDCGQRGEPLVTEGRPLIVGDITALPLLDGSIDYVICSHVLEHMETPEKLGRALTELMRVGKRGYIETPSAVAEKLLGRPFHHWYVRKDGRTIIFTRKKSYRENEDLMRLFLTLERNSKTFFTLLHEHFDSFYVAMEWEGKFEYLIEGIPTPGEKDPGQDYPTDLVSGFHTLGEPLRRGHRLRMLLKRLIHKAAIRKVKVDLFRILACPICRRRVEHAAGRNSLLCAVCRKEYEIRNGIPIMVVD